MMSINKCKKINKLQITQGGITEGETAKRSERGRGRWGRGCERDDDGHGPRRVGSNLLAPACSRPDRLDPRD